MSSRFVRVTTATAIISLLTVVGGVVGAGTSPAGALRSYTAYVGNDKCASKSVSQITGPAWSVGSTTVPAGVCPSGIAFAPDGATAYVANSNDDTIIPINTSTFTGGTPFSVGVLTPHFVAVTPNGALLLTGGNGSDDLAVISTANTASLQTVPLGAGPEGIAITPDSSTAYVALNRDRTVAVVSLVGTPALVKTITFPAPGCSGVGIAMRPNGKTVYVACAEGSLWPITVTKNKAAAAPIAIPQTSGGQQVVITPNGRTAYVSNTNGAVYPVTLKTNTVGAAIAINQAYGLAVSPDGRYLLVGDGECCNELTPVTVVSVRTNTIAQTLDTGTNEVHRWLAFKP